MSFSKRNKNRRLIAEINVTPFVDVLLIILIIFMVTAPLLNSGFDVNLPQSAQATIKNEKDKKIVISIASDGSIYLDKQLIKGSDIVKRLSGYDKSNTQIFIQADKDVTYQNVISIMSNLNQSGFSNISLVTTEIK